MNILISTTTNWNPGDDFIRFGVQNLLNEILDDVTYIHYDRNPDLFYKNKWEMGENNKSNCMNNPIDWSMIDLVVLAGSPEFLHGPLKPIYEGLFDHPEIPLIAMGVGYSFDTSSLVLNEKENFVLSRSNSLIITRQYDLSTKLSEILNKSDIKTLPCPALFASMKEPVDIVDKTAVIVQSPIGNHALSEQDHTQTVRVLDIKHSNIISHYIDDYKYFKRGFYSPDPHLLLKEILKYDTVISNRLHGGIVALGNYSMVKFINSDNRVQKALEPLKSYIKGGFYEILPKELDKIKEEYLNTINSFLIKLVDK